MTSLIDTSIRNAEEIRRIEQDQERARQMTPLIDISIRNAQEIRRIERAQERADQLQIVNTVTELETLFDKAFDDLSNNRQEDFANKAIDWLVTKGNYNSSWCLVCIDENTSPYYNRYPTWNDEYKYIPKHITKYLMVKTMYHIKSAYKSKTITDKNSKLYGAIVVYRVHITSNNYTKEPAFEIYVALKEPRNYFSCLT